MNLKSLFIKIGKLVLCGMAFSVGMIIGGMITSMMGLPQPAMPEGLNPEFAMLLLLLESPVLALVLALLARHLSGSFWSRTFILFFLTWISNSLNNQIEAAVFAGMTEGFWFTIITFLFPAFFMSMAVAWFFPPLTKIHFIDAAKSFFARYSPTGWIWRLISAAVLFMPIYYFFGLLVIPITRSYYEHNMYGLEIPTIDRLLVILLIRSVLFLVACLPILAAWQASRQSLVWRLGLALFYLVGFQSLLIANWMPWALRLPHMIEILFDEFVYAGALVWLLSMNQIQVSSVSWNKTVQVRKL